MPEKVAVPVLGRLFGGVGERVIQGVNTVDPCACKRPSEWIPRSNKSHAVSERVRRLHLRREECGFDSYARWRRTGSEAGDVSSTDHVLVLHGPIPLQKCAVIGAIQGTGGQKSARSLAA